MLLSSKGVISEISKNRLYGMIRKPDGSLLTFEMQDEHFNLEEGEQVSFFEESGNFMRRATNVTRVVDEDAFGKLFS